MKYTFGPTTITPNGMLQTGARIADGGTIGGAIGLAQDNLRYRGRKALAAVIKATREKYGRAN